MLQEIPRILPEVNPQIQESFDDRKKRCWDNVLERIAPSLISTPPPRGYLTTAIACDFVNEDFKASQPKLDKLDPTNTIFAARQILYTAYLSASDNPHLEGIEQNFLKTNLDTSPSETTIGVNFIRVAPEDGGVILLPEIPINSKAWDNFYRLSQMLGLEGSNLLLKYFPESIMSLTSDRQNSMPTDIKDSLEGTNWYYAQKLLSAAYANASDKEIRQLSISSVISKRCYKNTSISAKKIAAKLIVKNLPTIDQEGLLDPIHGGTSSPEQNRIISDIIDASIILNVSYEDLAKSIYESIGLRALCKSILSAVPDNIDLGKNTLTTILTLPKLNEELNVKSNKIFAGPNCITNTTLSTIQNEMRSIGYTPNTPSITEVTDAIITHELLHGLLTIKRTALTQSPKKTPHFLPTDEILIEAIRLNLGYRSSVEKCEYYVASKKEIESQAAKLNNKSPEAIEKMLDKYITTKKLPYSPLIDTIITFLIKELEKEINSHEKS